MSYPAAAIRTAVAELLEGTIGSTRTVPPNTFARGVFDGQSVQAQKAKALQTSTARHWFDVECGALRNNPSTPLSNLGSYRICTLDIVIRVTSAVATQAQADQRAADVALIMSDCEQAALALAYPHNLTATSAAVATDIVGGCLRGAEGVGVPTVERLQQDWTRQLVTTLITCQAVVRIEPAVEALLPFAEAVIAAGGAELQEFWVVEDDAAFRTAGTGAEIAALIGQVAGVEAGNSAGRPEIDATGAGNDHGSARFNGSPGKVLFTPFGSFVAAQGERWGLFVCGKFHAAPGATNPQPMASFGYLSGAETGMEMHIDRTTAGNVEASIHVDANGGEWATETLGPIATDAPLLAATWASNPHTSYFNGTTTEHDATAGLSSRASNTGEAFVMCGYPHLVFLQYRADFDLWCAGLFKLSGTDVPTGWPAMAALIRDYYGEATL